MEVKRGSFLTSYSKIAEDTKLSIQSVRTAIKNLESTGELTRESTSQLTKLTICKYDAYNNIKDEANKPANKPANNQSTDGQQTTNKRLTTTNNENHYNPEEEIEIRTQEPRTSSSIDPTETTKPAAGKRYEFAKIYSKVKPFNPNSAEFQNAYFQAVDVADGEDVVNVAASMYVQYCEDLSKPIQYIPNAARWLDTRQFASDWKAETMKELEERAEKGDKEAETKYMKYYIEAKQK